MILFYNRIMALYVHPQNQEMLWTVMNKVPVITQFFETYPPSQKETWFKSVIQMFYDKIGNRTIASHELQQWNQETITYILTTIQEKTRPPPRETMPQFTSPFTPQPTEQFNSSYINAPLPQAQQQQQQSQQQQLPSLQSHIFKTSAQEKQETLDKQFASREKEYQSIFDRPVPAAPDFSEKIEDTAISNMDELIRQQRQMREQELRQYAPPPPQNPQQNPPLRIDATPVNIRAEIIESEVDNGSTASARKSVTFGDVTERVIPAYEEILQLHATEITDMKNIVVRLADTLGSLAQDIQYIKQHIDASSLCQYGHE